MLKLFHPAPVDTLWAVIASRSCTRHWLMPSGLSPADDFATLAAECAIEALGVSATAAGPSVSLAMAAVLMVANGGRILEKVTFSWWLTQVDSHCSKQIQYRNPKRHRILLSWRLEDPHENVTILAAQVTRAAAARCLTTGKVFS